MGKDLPLNVNHHKRKRFNIYPLFLFTNNVVNNSPFLIVSQSWQIKRRWHDWVNLRIAQEKAQFPHASSSLWHADTFMGNISVRTLAAASGDASISLLYGSGAHGPWQATVNFPDGDRGGGKGGRWVSERGEPWQWLGRGNFLMSIHYLH